MTDFSVRVNLIIQNSRKHRLRANEIVIQVNTGDSEMARNIALSQIVDYVDMRDVKRIIPTRFLVTRT